MANKNTCLKSGWVFLLDALLIRLVLIPFTSNYYKQQITDIHKPEMNLCHTTHQT